MAVTYPDENDARIPELIPNQDLIDIRKIFGIPGEYLLEDANQYYTNMNDAIDIDKPVEGIGASSAVDNLFRTRQDDDRGITALLPTFTRDTPIKRKTVGEITDLDKYTLDDIGDLKLTDPAPLKGFEKFKERFFSPKVKGTLGDRLQRQYDMTSQLPSLVAGIAGIRNPFNPDSATYNPNLVGQLNYYEATGNIGRDPNTGGLKYGPNSVLAGKNVISGFGTNNPELALKNYIEKMEKNKKVSAKHKAKKLKQAKEELKNLQDNTEDKTPKIDLSKISYGPPTGEFDTGPDRGGSSLDQSADSQVQDDEGNYYD